MGPTALFPFRRKACRGFFRPENFRRVRPALNMRTWVLKASMLPLDHRSRFDKNIPLSSTFNYSVQTGYLLFVVGWFLYFKGEDLYNIHS
jgi:hypothetical protein